MLPASSLLLRAALATTLALTVAACPGDDGSTPVDAPLGPDSSGVCALPTTPITCTAGDDAPCKAMCDVAYCHNFSQLGVVCTRGCTDVSECPSGWSCNNMGRCRPPNP